MTNGKPSEVKRDSDFSVTVVFPSCRLASEFEREMQSRAMSVYADGGKGEVVRFQSPLDGRWITAPQAECAPLDKIPSDRIVAAWKAAGRLETVGDNHEQAVAMVRALQAECAPRAKERLWLMIADNFTREEFEQAFAECAPRADAYAFKCDGQLWVVTDVEVAEKWKAQGFEVTPVERADAEKDAARYRWLRADGFIPNDFEKVVDAAILAANKEKS